MVIQQLNCPSQWPTKLDHRGRRFTKQHPLCCSVHSTSNPLAHMCVCLSVPVCVTITTAKGLFWQTVSLSALWSTFQAKWALDTQTCPGLALLLRCCVHLPSHLIKAFTAHNKQLLMRLLKHLSWNVCMHHTKSTGFKRTGTSCGLSEFFALEN